MEHTEECTLCKIKTLEYKYVLLNPEELDDDWSYRIVCARCDKLADEVITG